MTGDSGRAERHERVDLGQFVRELWSSRSVRGTWDQTVALALAHIPGVSHAGVMVSRRGRFATAAASTDVVSALDDSQLALGEGPSLDAMRRVSPVGSGDLGSDRRWPGFGPLAATRFGIRSTQSFCVYIGDEALGALTFYSAGRDAFGDETVSAGSALAAVAASGARDGERADALHVALSASRVISTATGIIRERHHLTEESAFALLREVGQRNNRTMRDVAEAVVSNRDLPDGPAALQR